MSDVETHRPTAGPRPPRTLDLPGPAAGDDESGWDVADLDTDALVSPAAVAASGVGPQPDGSRRLLTILAVVLLAGAAVAYWRVAGWWDASPSSPVDGLASESDATRVALDSEQRAFQERSRRRAVAAAVESYEEEVVVGPFGEVRRAEPPDPRELDPPPNEPDLPFVFESPGGSDGLTSAAYVEALWRQAIGYRQAGDFGRLADALDRLLAVEPGHRAARAWRDALPRMQRDQRKAAERLLRDRLSRFEAALEGQRVDALQSLWAGRLDPQTRSFIGHLFSQRATLRVTMRPRWLEVDDRSAIRFGASVTVERRGDRGLRDVTIDRYDWDGRLEGGQFVGPFPG